jgi:hypothetical protein
VIAMPGANRYRRISFEFLPPEFTILADRRDYALDSNQITA